MNEGHSAPHIHHPLPDGAGIRGYPLHFQRVGWTVAVLTILFALPLIDLARLAFNSDLYSHIPLIPAACVYLAWIQRHQLPPPGPPDRLVSGLCILMCLPLLAIYFLGGSGSLSVPHVDKVAAVSAAYVLLVGASAAWFFGGRLTRMLAFPLSALMFMVPMPTMLVVWTETLLQHGSAVAAHGLFHLSGMPVFRDGTLFMLPGFSMEVAPECSGIRSTLALFITSTFAAYLFLRRPWSRLALTLAVIPLALARNGLRVWTIGTLCVEVGPEMIDSFVHHKGGPIFFGLSLIPFSALLWVFVRWEKRQALSLSRAS